MGGIFAKKVKPNLAVKYDLFGLNSIVESSKFSARSYLVKQRVAFITKKADKAWRRPNAG